MSSSSSSSSSSNRLELFSSSTAATPRVCTIAGSDSGGGAGIQADLKTFLALGAYGLSVVTALTAQNTQGVQAIHSPPAEFVQAQLKSVQDDIRIDAWKIGMLANEDIVRTVAENLSKRFGKAPIVLDPVMVSTSGSLLLSHSSIEALVSELLPLCSILTPNLPEAKAILQHSRKGKERASRQPEMPKNGDSLEVKLATVQELLSAARELTDLGTPAVIVKGGHQPMKRSELEIALAEMQWDYEQTKMDHDLGTGCSVKRGAVAKDGSRLCCVRTDCSPSSLILRNLSESSMVSDSDDLVVMDVLYEASRQEYTLFVKRLVDRTCTHGTGCTLSSAIAVHLSAAGAAPPSSSIRGPVWKGIQYVQEAIMRGYEDLGEGPGPLNHATNIGPRAHSLSTAAEVLLQPYTDQENGDVSAILSRRLHSTQQLGHDPTPLVSTLISNSEPLWLRYVGHPFVTALSDPQGFSLGTSKASPQGPLPFPAFVYFLKQDFHFLHHYSRVWSLAASLCTASNTSVPSLFRSYFLSTSSGMLDEASEHVKMCSDHFGIHDARAVMEREQEGTAVLAYTRFVMDAGHSMGLLGLLVATMPCLLGYAEMGARLQKRRQERQQDLRGQEGSKDVPSTLVKALDHWVDMYTCDAYKSAVYAGLVVLETMAIKEQINPARLRELQSVWDTAVRCEIALWDESLLVGAQNV